MVDLPFVSRSEPDLDDVDAFVPEHLPEPGPFLADHEVLRGDAHVDVHRASHAIFEERGVYDATFGYNLAELNRDWRHPDAGLRYARESPGVLRVEFTPTTPFCPQARTLALGTARAWNDLGDEHGWAVVRVRVREHHRSGALAGELAAVEREEEDHGDVAGSDWVATD